MKTKAICLSTVVGLALAGCATPGSNQGNAQSGAALGAAVGGAGSYLLCKLSGRSNADCLAFAAVGAAVGGTIGWKQGKEKDLVEVRAMNDSFKRAGVPSTVDTARVQGKDDGGKPVAVDAFKGITVPLDPVVAEIKADNQNVTKAMQDLGVLSVTRNEPTRIIYRVGPTSGPKVRTWINQGIDQGLKANPKGVEPVVQELPFERGKPEFVRVEAKDQTQFASLGNAIMVAQR
jgi:hypothetical protein